MPARRSAVPPPRTGRPYLDAVLDQPGAVLALAHRGGAYHPELEGLENTLTAFRHAVALGYHYLETDVHVSVDGVLLAFHDDALERVTDGTGEIARLTHTQVRAARIGGREEIPTFAALVEEFPEARFNVDLKSDGAVAVLADLVERHGLHDRLLVGSFAHARLRDFRRLTRGRVATAATPPEVAVFLATGRARGFDALQVPVRAGRLPVTTSRLVRLARRAGVHVHTWTVDDPAEMHRLLDVGVHGLFTDRTDLLRDVLTDRGQWLAA